MVSLCAATYVSVGVTRTNRNASAASDLLCIVAPDLPEYARPKELGRGRQNEAYITHNTTLDRNGADAIPLFVISPQDRRLPPTGTHPVISIFSNAITTAGYCRCTHLYCSVVQVPTKNSNNELRTSLHETLNVAETIWRWW